MTVKDILDRITKADVISAMATFKVKPYTRKVKDSYVLEYNGKNIKSGNLLCEPATGTLKKFLIQKTIL
jgi:hypothetical protein